MSFLSKVLGKKEAVREKQLQNRLNTFRSSMDAGLAVSKKLILKHSAKCRKAVQGSPVEKVADNLDETIKTFVNDENAEFMRFQPLANRIVELVMRDRSPDITTMDSLSKLTSLGEAYGFMAGTAVMTACTNVFLQQAIDRLQQQETLTQQAKTLCLSYINDGFTLILMALTAELDGKYATAKKERKVFAEILKSNEWADGPKDEDQAQAPAETAPEAPATEEVHVTQPETTDEPVQP